MPFVSQGAEKSLRFYRNLGATASGQQESELKDELAKFVQVAKENAEPVRLSEFCKP